MTKIITYIKDFYASYRLYLIASVLTSLSLIGSYHAGKAVGAAEEKGSTAVAQAAADKKGVTDHEKIKQDVLHLRADDLDKRLDKWMRD